MINDEESMLALEIETVYGLVPGPPGGVRRVAKPGVEAVFGWSPGAAVLAVSDRMADLAVDTKPAMAQRFAPEVVPSVLDILRNALEDLGRRVTVTGGPSFIFPEELPEMPSSLPLIVSDEAGRDRARKLDRPSNWEPDEWAQLVAGELGPWAMALDDNSPVSITFTPEATDVSAETGAWTRADHRGAGLAAAVTRAWWELEGARKQVIFYSTDSDNRPSQAVARKLGLRPLGWLWALQ